MKISIVMPVYNAGAYLAGALESLLAQTLRDFELIAVDDGSTDGSLAVLQAYAARDARVRIVSRPNTGIVGALNDGLAAASAPLVARMDADDLAEPGRLEAQADYLQTHPECVAVGSAVLFIDPEGRPLKTYHPNTDHDGIEADLAGGNGGALIHPAVMFRREVVLNAGGYRARYQYVEDLDLYVRLLEHGQLANLPGVHLRYRQHAQSINHVQGAKARAALAAELIAPLRERNGLPPLSAEELAENAPRFSGLDACRRKWALDAAEGGHYDAAWANALLAVKARPFSRRNWSTLSYIRGLRKTAQPR